MTYPTGDDSIETNDGPASAAVVDECIKEEIVPTLQRSDTATAPCYVLLRILRRLLRLPDEELTRETLEDGVQEFREYYRQTYPLEDEGWYLRQDPHETVSSCVSDFTWKLSMMFSQSNTKHTALAEFVTVFKNTSPSVFDPENPQAIFDPVSVLWVSKESFEDYWIHQFESSWSRLELLTYCNRCIRSAAFQAKLLASGVFETGELGWTCNDLESNLVRNAVSEPLARSGQVVHAAQYILIAGHVLVEEIKKHVKPIWPRSGAWKSWAEQFRRVACSDVHDDYWGAKQHAAEAHSKMIELWPELFPNEAASRPHMETGSYTSGEPDSDD